jgi:apolipoprotein N-acyltransferase
MNLEIICEKKINFHIFVYLFIIFNYLGFSHHMPHLGSSPSPLISLLLLCDTSQNGEVFLFVCFVFVFVFLLVYSLEHGQIPSNPW